METFVDFAWPAYGAVPGLRKSCEAFLSEPLVLQAEDELRRYWKGYWTNRDKGRVGTSEGWNDLMTAWIDRLAPVPRRTALGLATLNGHRHHEGVTKP